MKFLVNILIFKGENLMQKPIRILHVVQRMEAAGVQNLLMNIYRNIDRTKVQFDFLVHYEEKQFFDDEIGLFINCSG